MSDVQQWKPPPKELAWRMDTLTRYIGGMMTYCNLIPMYVSNLVEKYAVLLTRLISWSAQRPPCTVHVVMCTQRQPIYVHPICIIDLWKEQLLNFIECQVTRILEVHTSTLSISINALIFIPKKCELCNRDAFSCMGNPSVLQSCREASSNTTTGSIFMHPMHNRVPNFVDGLVSWCCTGC